MNLRDELNAFGVLAGTMGSMAKIYHVGFVVPDLEEAMQPARSRREGEGP